VTAADTSERDRAYLLTPPGAGAIAVVRLVGPGVAAFLRARFSRPAVESRCVHGDLSSADGAVLDDPVVVLLPGGRSADVSLHGGAWVVQSVLDLLRKEGFDVTQPAASDPELPVPLDAVDGANVLEREVNAHFSLAKTELAVRVLTHQVGAWREIVRRATPGPGEESHLARWTQRAEGIKAELSAVLADRSLWWLLHTPRVAIVGAPNVGKSTLANRLFAQERVITADLPGTTRDWVGEIANLDGLAVMLVDTPGIRRTDDAIEAEAIARSGEQVQSADLVVVVTDATRPMEGEQADVLEAWPDALRVINKTDAAAPEWDLALVGGVRTVGTSGAGVDELRRAIRSRFGIVAGMDERWPRWWTPRQKQVLEDALGRVELVGRMIEG
jgi:tRNA modification GTPase